jgi:hypothetical protein
LLVSGNFLVSIASVPFSRDLSSSGADFIFIPERPPKGNPWEDEMCATIHRVITFPFYLQVIQSLSINMRSIVKWANAKPS